MTITITPEQVEAKVYESLAEFGANADALNRDAQWDALGVDSLDLVELVQVLEDEYGVRLTGEDMKNLPTVGSVIDLVVSRSAP
jgi:acyl carrier protein